MPSPSPQPAIRFGSFEVDLKAGELRKQGLRIKLHDKPLQVLLALLEHPGEVVTRKELQERLWPGDTFVEFENGLNNAISRLREALGDTSGSPRFIETVPRHGYRFLAEIAGLKPGLYKTAEASSPSRRAIPRKWVFVFGGILVAGLAVGGVYRMARGRDPAIHSLAVLPFRNLSVGVSDEYFTDGMTDAVTTELAKLGVAKVISETSVGQFKDTKKSVPEIARALEVDAVVEGAVLREGNQVRITVQLIRGDTDKHVWAESYQRQLTDILALQDEVALGVARAIKVELSPGTAGRPSSPKPVNGEGYEAYLKGRYFMQKGDDSFFRTGDYFQQAIQLDPGYAPAYAGLSQYYVLLSTGSLPPEQMIPKEQALSKAREYAKKAMQLDPDLPDSHASLAYLDFNDWNWQEADREFQRAITLAPGVAQTHELYSTYLSAMGRGTEAMAEATHALDLDPLSIGAHNVAGVAASCNGQPDRTVEEGGKIFELDAKDPRAYLDMSIGHYEKGMYQEAQQEIEKGLVLSHRDPFFLAIAAAVYGRLGQMEQAAKLVKEMRADSKSGAVAPYYFAIAFAGMGEQKQAVDALEEAYKTHDAYMGALKSDPLLGPLHSNPRFEDLVRKMNFPTIAGSEK